MTKDKATSYITTETLSTKTTEWLTQIERVNRHKWELRVDSAALLVVDMQEYFLHPTAPAFTPAALAIIDNVRRLTDLFRNLERPIIYTCHVHAKDGSDAGFMGEWWNDLCLEGSDHAPIVAALTPQSGDNIILKNRYSAFHKTDLDQLLRRLEVQEIIITGVRTNLCCETTARDAAMRDYRVFIPADATATISEQMHLASLLNLAYGFGCVTRTDELIHQIGAAGTVAHRTLA